MFKKIYKNSRKYWWKKKFFQLRKKFIHFLNFFSKNEIFKKKPFYKINRGFSWSKKTENFSWCRKWWTQKSPIFVDFLRKSWLQLKLATKKCRKVQNILKTKDFFLLIFYSFYSFYCKRIFAVKIYSFAVKFYSFLKKFYSFFKILSKWKIFHFLSTIFIKKVHLQKSLFLTHKDSFV